MSEKRGEKETARVEAFSDGVFAIAITLLILEIKVPHLPSGAGSRELLPSLLAEWPSLLAFALSFTAVLVIKYIVGARLPSWWPPFPLAICLIASGLPETVVARQVICSKGGVRRNFPPEVGMPRDPVIGGPVHCPAPSAHRVRPQAPRTSVK